MTTVFPEVEPLRADLAGDGMDLPIYNINIGGAQSFAVQVQRHGLRLKIAKRFVDESAYPWTRSLRPSGQQNPRAHAHKEDGETQERRSRRRSTTETERISAAWPGGVWQVCA